MSQNDLVIDNQSFPATRSDINSALQALGSLNSGTTAPATTYANMMWYDTTNNILKMRSEANDAWISIGTLNQSLNTFTPAGVATQTTATWEVGTDTTESLVSAAKVAAAIAASASLTLNDYTESFGSTGSEGYTVFPNGLIIQWGRTGTLSGDILVTLPIAFPNAHITGVASPSQSSALTGNVSAYYVVQSLTQCRITHDASGNSDSSPVGWIAIGY